MTAVTDRMSILKLRKIRKLVEDLTNLVGNGERIRAVAGTWWSADLVERTVEWIPMWPFPPFAEIDEFGIRYCVAHEASHLKWSGLYETKRIKDHERARFHRLVNAVEDVRVDRMSATQFGTFREAQQKVRTLLYRSHDKTGPEGWSLVDAVGLNAVAVEVGLAPQGTQLAIDASTRLWPKLSRIANLRSTQEVASALEPIFRKLVEVEGEEKSREEAEAEAAAEALREEMQRRWERFNSPEGQQDDGDPASGVSGGPDGEQKENGEQTGSAPGDPADGANTGQNDPPPDPLAGLDKLRTPGADKPTDSPIKSDGAAGTEPLPLGQELEGMEKDSTDYDTSRKLNEQKQARDKAKQTTSTLRDRQLGKRARPTPAGRVRYEQARDEMRGSINTLANRLKSVLRQNAMEAGSTGHRRGRFDPGRAYRLKTGNPKVFRQPGHVGGLDYAFGLLVDVSSSMTREINVNGQKMEERKAAFTATVLIAEALERAGLGVFVVAWSSEIPHVKPLAEPLENHRAQLGEAFWTGGSTVESPALALAIEEMRKVRGRRMIITITDGETKNVEESKELLGEFEHDGVMPVAIRIGGPPAGYYRHGYSVAHAGELTVLLPRLINQVVRRGA